MFHTLKKKANCVPHTCILSRISFMLEPSLSLCDSQGGTLIDSGQGMKLLKGSIGNHFYKHYKYFFFIFRLFLNKNHILYIFSYKH